MFVKTIKIKKKKKKIEKKKVIIHVCVEFCDKAVIRPRLLGRVGCLQKGQA